MPPGDADLLGRSNVLPPSRLGSIGRIGKFELVKALGQGGMARVFLATEPVTGASVALKMLRSDLADDPRVVKSFLAEARHMYELSHPNILKVLEVSGPDEGAFFVMPLVRTGSLYDRIGAGKMSGDEVLAVCTQVTEGLAYAHSKGLIHRDLKPANVLLDEEGRALIADFGLVRPFFNDSLVDGAGTHPVGTPAYMSPRVAAGFAEDTRADIYAFGAMMYEMLAGRPPYTGRDPMRVVQAVVEGPPAALSTVTTGAPAGLVAIAEWCMSRELRDRYASMNDVLDDLRRVSEGRTPRGPHDTGIRNARTRALAIVGAGAVVMLAVLGAVATYALRRGRGTGEQPVEPTASTVPAEPVTPAKPAVPPQKVTATEEKDEEPLAPAKPAEPVETARATVPAEDAMETETGRQVEPAPAMRPIDEAHALREAGNLDAAAAKYGEALQANPSDVRTLYWLGVVELARGRTPSGIDLLRRANALDPADAPVARALVAHFMEVGHLREARRVIDAWLRADPGNTDAHEMLRMVDELERARADGMEPGDDQPPLRVPGRRRPPGGPEDGKPPEPPRPGKPWGPGGRPPPRPPR